ncbi:hypothetical protein Barb4_01284 [Bacteroidales bacterium Barb4]|nr:hypothetical protein Barb4_01284 [Bacteroidales bacterium Barb4]
MNAITSAIIRAIETVFWDAIATPMFFIIDGLQDIFMSVGGAGIMNALITATSTSTALAVSISIMGGIFLIAIAVRGIKIAMAKNADEGEYIRRSTVPNIIAAAVAMASASLIFI